MVAAERGLECVLDGLGELDPREEAGVVVNGTFPGFFACDVETDPFWDVETGGSRGEIFGMVGLEGCPFRGLMSSFVVGD